MSSIFLALELTVAFLQTLALALFCHPTPSRIKISSTVFYWYFLYLIVSSIAACFSFQRKTVWHKLPWKVIVSVLSCVRLCDLMDCNTQASCPSWKVIRFTFPPAVKKYMLLQSLTTLHIAFYYLSICKEKILPIYFASHSLYFSMKTIFYDTCIYKFCIFSS